MCTVLDVLSLLAQCLLTFSHLSKRVGTRPVSVLLDSWRAACIGNNARDRAWVEFFPALSDGCQDIGASALSPWLLQIPLYWDVEKFEVNVRRQTRIRKCQLFRTCPIPVCMCVNCSSLSLGTSPRAVCFLSRSHLLHSSQVSPVSPVRCCSVPLTLCGQRTSGGKNSFKYKWHQSF